MLLAAQGAQGVPATLNPIFPVIGKEYDQLHLSVGYSAKDYFVCFTQRSDNPESTY